MNYLASWIWARLKQSACHTASQLVMIVLVAYAGLGLLWPLAIHADTIITVTEITDELQQDGDCSLREAVQVGFHLPIFNQN